MQLSYESGRRTHCGIGWHRVIESCSTSSPRKSYQKVKFDRELHWWPECFCFKLIVSHQWKKSIDNQHCLCYWTKSLHNSQFIVLDTKKNWSNSTKMEDTSSATYPEIHPITITMGGGGWRGTLRNDVKLDDGGRPGSDSFSSPAMETIWPLPTSLRCLDKPSAFASGLISTNGRDPCRLRLHCSDTRPLSGTPWGRGWRESRCVD